MKKIVTSLFIFSCISFQATAQTTNFVQKQSIGFSVIANDYTTADRIRSSSLSAVLRQKQFSKIKEMGLGVAVHYIKSALPNIDVAASFGGSFVKFSLPGKITTDSRFLAELDVSGNFKMFDQAFFNPYLIAGIGASKYTNVFGAFIPLGGGVNINLFNEAKLFSQFQYRVPVTPDANKHHFQISFGIAGSL